MAKNNTPADPKPNSTPAEPEAETQAGPVAKNSTQEEQKVTCEILRDFWDGEGNRKPKGTLVDLGVDEALDMIETGIAARVKK